MSSYHDRVKQAEEQVNGSNHSQSIQAETSSRKNNDLARGSFVENWPNGVRWALFLPAASIVAFFGQALFYLAMASFDGIKDGSLLSGLISAAQTGLMFFLFIYVGSLVAPKHQFNVAVVLLIISVIILSLMLAAILYFSDNYYDAQSLYVLFHVIVGVISSAGTLLYIKDQVEN